LWTVVVAGLRPSFVLTQPIAWVTLIGKDIAGVIQDNVEDDVKTLRVRRIDQGPQLVICILRVVCKPWLGMEEVVDAVSMIATV